MIVIASKPGQLGNLLIVYASLLAFGEEHGIRISNPAFHRYNHLFKGSARHKGSAFRFRLNYYLARLVWKAGLGNRLVRCVYIDWEESFDLDARSSAVLLRSALCFVQGWKFRGARLLQKHREQIIPFFSLTDTREKALDDFFSRNFRSGQLIIGIHIRRGDYRQFEQGRYFYGISDYVLIIQHLAKVFEKNNPHFLICSNEALDRRDLENGEFSYTLGPGDESGDLYALSRCSYIAGPPSTYSMWASFYGQKPLYMIRNPQERPQPEQFIIQSSF